MSPSPRGIAVVLGSLLALGAGSQVPLGARPPQARPTSMVEVLLKMPWEPATQGPLVAIARNETAAGTTLDDLDMKTVAVGGLSAVVPKTMVTVNSRFTAAPNMYEGLPQDAKVMYLLRTLTPGQWNKATGGGIGFADLQGEQVAVFESILPNPLRYSMGAITADGSLRGQGGGEPAKTLSGEARAKVKIRIVRHLWMQLAVANDGGYTAGDLPEDEKAGTPMANIQEDKETLFGQRILVRSPNVPRKSQLDLRDARLGATVAFNPQESVKDLLARVTAATGVRLVADPHYAIWRVVERGASAAARDLLGAVSLGVAGTYRKVGDTYVLTNDLEGMAAHTARVAVWEDALKKEVDRLKEGWRSEIAAGPGFRKIAYHSPIFGGLTQAEQANLEANDKPRGNPAYIPVGQASKPVQDALRAVKNGLQIDKEKVGLSSNIRYEIVLPGVGRSWWRGWLDNTDRFMEKPGGSRIRTPAPVTLPLETNGAVAGLVLRADTPAEAKRLVSRVAKLGIGELLLETRDVPTLNAAVEAGAASKVKIGLAVRPWALGPSETSADPDRTAPGERGKGLAASKAALGPLRRFWEDIAAYEPPTRELIAPLDPATNAHVALAKTLAATKGLSRVVVLDLYPVGYGKEDSRSTGSYWYSAPVDLYLAYGYSEALREAYLRAEGVDPLDLETQMISSDIQFGPAWGARYGYGAGIEKWQAAKGKWSHARALALAQTLRAADPTRPLLMPGEPPMNYLPPLPATSFYRWTGTEELPVAPQDYGGGEVPEAAEFQLLLLSDDPDPLQRNRVADRLKKLLTKPPKPLVLDLSSVPSARLEAVIARWLKDKTP